MKQQNRSIYALATLGGAHTAFGIPVDMLAVRGTVLAVPTLPSRQVIRLTVEEKMARFGLARSKKSTAGTQPAAPRTHRLEVVLGTLRSDLDEPDQLPDEFVSLVSHIGENRVLYERGELSRHEFAAILASAVITTPDGTEWTTGATSGQWYKRAQGTRWEPASPPSLDSIEIPEDDVLARYFSGASQLVTDNATPPTPPPNSPASGLPSLSSSNSQNVQPDPKTSMPPTNMPAATPKQTKNTVDDDDPFAAMNIGTEPISESPPAYAGLDDLIGLDVDSAAADAPYPAVTQGPSQLPLPETSTRVDAIIDDTGVWSSGWESTAKTTGYPVPPEGPDALVVDPDDNGRPPAKDPTAGGAIAYDVDLEPGYGDLLDE